MGRIWDKMRLVDAQFAEAERLQKAPNKPRTVSDVWRERRCWICGVRKGQHREYDVDLAIPRSGRAEETGGGMMPCPHCPTAPDRRRDHACLRDQGVNRAVESSQPTLTWAFVRTADQIS